jgi:tetratricopeptide (TPR) repeat protein
MFRTFPWLATVLVFLAVPGQSFSEPMGKMTLPANTSIILDHIYSGRRDLALTEVHELEAQEPDNPVGYLLEAEAEWWKIWCASVEFKYGMTMARHHEKSPGDRHYLELTTKAYALAQANFHGPNGAEMHLYAGMADGLAARLCALRSEYRATARAGVRGRENFMAALALDPSLADAYTGLGLYNYYVDTLSVLAKALRLLMGIPGGSKEEGIRQLRRGIEEGQMTPSLARFYLGTDLLNYDQRYEEALKVYSPLAAKYPENPLFQLTMGDLNAKLGRKKMAEAHYHAAEEAANKVPEPECRAKMKQLAAVSLESVEGK